VAVRQGQQKNGELLLSITCERIDAAAEIHAKGHGSCIAQVRIQDGAQVLAHRQHFAVRFVSQNAIVWTN
jgi:hypothetical protein